MQRKLLDFSSWLAAMAIQAALHWSGSRAPKTMAVCAHVLSTVTTAGEPFFDQSILRFILMGKADSSKKTQLVLKSMPVPSHSPTQSRHSWIFFSLCLSKDWNQAILSDRLHCVLTKSQKVPLETLSPSNL